MVDSTADKVAHLDFPALFGNNQLYSAFYTADESASECEISREGYSGTMGSDGIPVIIDPSPNDTLLVDGTLGDGSSFSRSCKLSDLTVYPDGDNSLGTVFDGSLAVQVLHQSEAIEVGSESGGSLAPLASNASGGGNTLLSSNGSLGSNPFGGGGNPFGDSSSSSNAFLQSGGGNTDFTLAASDGSVTVDNYIADNSGNLGTVSFDSTVAFTNIAVGADAAGDLLLRNTATGGTERDLACAPGGVRPLEHRLEAVLPA